MVIVSQVDVSSILCHQDDAYYKVEKNHTIGNCKNCRLDRETLNPLIPEAMAEERNELIPWRHERGLECAQCPAFLRYPTTPEKFKVPNTDDKLNDDPGLCAEYIEKIEPMETK